MITGIFMMIPVSVAATSVELNAPKNLKLLNPKVDTVLLVWDQVTDAEHYYVYISESKDKGYQMVCGLEKNQLLIEGLKENTV